MVVPCEAILYAQVVESDLVSRWNTLHQIRLDDNASLKVDAASNRFSTF